VRIVFVGFDPKAPGIYEMLIGKPGLGIADFDAQTIAHAILLAFIVVGNLTQLRARAKKGD